MMRASYYVVCLLLLGWAGIDSRCLDEFTEFFLPPSCMNKVKCLTKPKLAFFVSDIHVTLVALGPKIFKTKIWFLWHSIFECLTLETLVTLKSDTRDNEVFQVSDLSFFKHLTLVPLLTLTILLLLLLDFKTKLEWWASSYYVVCLLLL